MSFRSYPAKIGVMLVPAIPPVDENQRDLPAKEILATIAISPSFLQENANKLAKTLITLSFSFC